MRHLDAVALLLIFVTSVTGSGSKAQLSFFSTRTISQQRTTSRTGMRGQGRCAEENTERQAQQKVSVGKGESFTHRRKLAGNSSFLFF